VEKILVAGVGNVRFGDDGFGVEVARRLAAAGELPANVEVWDAGIRSFHLAFRLLDEWELFVAIDLVARGGAPGTLYVLEPELGDAPAPASAHSMDLRTVFGMVRTLGGRLGRSLIVGCEPGELVSRTGLSPAVSAAVEPAARRVLALTAGKAITFARG
jgi:hydrogenase maturation protease